MSPAKVRSARSMHCGDRKRLVWNHGNWTKVDRLFRRAERHALKREINREWS